MLTSTARTGATATGSTRTGSYRDSHEWGPAKHDPEHPFHIDRAGRFDTPAYGTALRDGDDALPDDN